MRSVWSSGSSRVLWSDCSSEDTSRWDECSWVHASLFLERPTFSAYTHSTPWALIRAYENESSAFLMPCEIYFILIRRMSRVIYHSRGCKVGKDCLTLLQMHHKVGFPSVWCWSCDLSFPEAFFVLVYSVC